MTFIDKDGWPVETIKGRPITNLIRILLHTSIWQTVNYIICAMRGHQETWRRRSQPNTVQPRYYIRCKRCGSIEDGLDEFIEKQEPHIGVGWLRKQDEGNLQVYELRIHKEK